MQAETNQPGLFISRNRLVNHDALNTYFKRGTDDCSPNINYYESNISGLSVQEVYARLHHNRYYVSSSVTDRYKQIYYKHQVLTGRMLHNTDAIFIIDDPGTGKTRTQLHAMMEQLKYRTIERIVIVNGSDRANIVARRTLKFLYDAGYISHFGMDYRRFEDRFINFITYKGINKGKFSNYTGIIIDEAHNLITDDDRCDVDKIVELEKFINKLNKLRGIKIILSTATPLFGRTDVIGTFRQILFRNQNEISQTIPASMLTFTKIDYPHLKIEQVLNSAFPRSLGDLSITLANGVKYPFYVYLNKPSPVQIADFAQISYDDPNAPFQCKGKPMIVASEPRIINGVEVVTSTMLDSILALINEKEDGTAIIYSELKEKGARTVAKYLLAHGFEEYTTKRNCNKTGGHRMHDPLKHRQRDLTNQRGAIEKDIAALKTTLFNVSEQHSQKLEAQLESFRKVGMPAEYIKSFENYIQDYRDSVLDNIYIQEQIDIKTDIRDDLVDQIRELMNGKSIPVQKRKRKFIVFTSGASNLEKAAFDDFNSDANWNGEICDVIIGSKLFRDGVDARHATQSHVIVPEWRIPGMQQADHRGIRSNGHEAIIHNRAINRVKAQSPDIPFDKRLTYDQARSQVIAEKVTIKLYHHYVSVKLLDESDIVAARPYITEPAIKAMPNAAILILLNQGAIKYGAGEIMYNRALALYVDVGAAMMSLWSKSLHYQLNVSTATRIKAAISKEDTEYQSIVYGEKDLYGVGDTELFYEKDYSDVIIDMIIKLLLNKPCIDTDDIFDMLLNDDPTIAKPFDQNVYVTESMIASAITELVKYRRYIYNIKHGVNMMVKLKEDETSSILYLTTSDNDDHPNNQHVEHIGFTIATPLDRVSTKITADDIKLPKNSQTFYKLKDLIERAMDEDRIIEQHEITFLIQMSNYWAFSWRDLVDPTMNRKYMSVYVFEGHITKPDINVLARDLRVYEYRVGKKEWRFTHALSLKNTFLVRYATMVELYRSFAFNLVPEFASYDAFQQSHVNFQDVNGIIFVKGYYNPDMTQPTLTQQLIGGEDVLIEPISRNVLVKTFMSTQSKGKQIKNKVHKHEQERPTAIRMAIENIAIDEITLFVFLYDKNNTVRTGYTNIIDIKRDQLHEMLRASDGRPTPRFMIPNVEKRVTDPARKQQIYRDIYKLPTTATAGIDDTQPGNEFV